MRSGRKIHSDRLCLCKYADVRPRDGQHTACNFSELKDTQLWAASTSPIPTKVLGDLFFTSPNALSVGQQLYVEEVAYHSSGRQHGGGMVSSWAWIRFPDNSLVSRSLLRTALRQQVLLHEDLREHVASTATTKYVPKYFAAFLADAQLSKYL